MADKRISQLTDRGTVANSDVVPIVVSGAVTTNKATISSIQVQETLLLIFLLHLLLIEGLYLLLIGQPLIQSRVQLP
jgi:hypothetical protein